MRTATVLSMVAALSMVLVLGTASLGYAQQGAPDGAWPAYGGDAGSTKYAPLDQINADNVDQLQVAWQWTTSDAPVLAENDLGAGAFKATPIMVHGVLYVRTSLSLVAAIVAATASVTKVKSRV